MMKTEETSFVPAVVSPGFDSFAVRQGVAGFLAGYGDATRQARTGRSPAGSAKSFWTSTTISAVWWS